MADREIGIDIKTTASGDGVAKTSDEIDKLRAGSEDAASTAQTLRNSLDGVEDISDDTRAALNGVADELDDVAKEGNLAADTAEKLAKGLDLTEDEGKRAAAALDRVGDEAKDAGRGLTQAEEASRRLVRAQQQASGSTRAVTTATNNASKANSNAGRSLLLASQGYEDLQFGIGGVLNNIPPLIQSLGGTAGLAGVISVVAVTAVQLSKHLGDNSEALAANAKAAKEAADLKIESGRAARRQSQELASEVEISAQILAAENDAIIKSIAAIDAQSAARQRAFSVQQQINNEQLGLDIAIVSGDSSLSELEKVTAILDLKRAAEEAKQQASQDKISADIAAEQEKLQAADEAGAALAEQHRQRQIELGAELEATIRRMEDLDRAIESNQKQLTKKTIPKLDQVLSVSTAEANVKNPFRLINPGSRIGSPDRKEFDSDEAFLDSSRTFFDNDKASNTTREAALPLLESAERQREQIEDSKKLKTELEGVIQKLKEQTEQAEQARIAASEARNEGVSKAQEEIDKLEELKQSEEALANIRNQRVAAESQNTVTGAAQNEVTREATELRGDLEADLESTGAATEEIAAARQVAEDIQRTISESLKDGVIDTNEFQKITTELSNFRRQFSTQNQATLSNISELMTAVSALSKISQAQGRQIQTINAGINSR